jgi:hypothetical protein
MKTSVAFLCAFFIVGSALADPYSMAIQQAQRASNQNAAEQRQLQNQDGSSGSSGAATGQNPPPTNPLLAATLLNITNLQTDISALNSSAGPKADPSQRIALLNDLSAAAQSTKASADSIKDLAKDLLTTMVGNQKMTPLQQKKLAREIHAVFNSSHLTDVQQQTIFNDVQKTLVDDGVPPDAATDVVTDLKKIAAETQ